MISSVRYETSSFVIVPILMVIVLVSIPAVDSLLFGIEMLRLLTPELVNSCRPSFKTISPLTVISSLGSKNIDSELSSALIETGAE